MQKILTTSITKLTSLFEIAKEKEIPLQTLLDRVGLNASILDSPDHRLSLNQVQQLTQAAADLTKDNNFGLHQGERFMGFSNIIGYVLMNCENLRQALDKLMLYQKICDEGTHIELEESGKNACLRVDIVDERLAADLHLTDYRLSGIYVNMKHLSGVSFDLSEVRFRHPAPNNSNEYQRIFKSPVLFGQSDNALVFPSHCLNLPIARSNRNLLVKFEQYAREILQGIVSKNVYSEKVQHCIASILRGQSPAIGEVARELAMSVRNLQLKLKAEDTTYRKILGEVRNSLAMKYLDDPDTPIAEIAYLLGYSEVSVFYRAFKKSSGFTPISYRNRFK